MSPQLIVELGLTQEEKSNFPQEVAALWNGLALAGSPDLRAYQDMLIIYRRRYSDLGKMERLFRPQDQLFLIDWFKEVMGEEDAPVNEANRRVLLSLAAAGMEAEELGDLVDAYRNLPDYREPDELYRKSSLTNLREYLNYLHDFAPYLSVQSNEFARQLLLTYTGLVSADLVARFVSVHRQQLAAMFPDHDLVDNPRATQWMVWYSLFQDHASEAKECPHDFCATPFNEVVRNVPAQVWFDVYHNDRIAGQWPFALRTDGFYHLAAGKSARVFLKEVGLSRSAWRAYLRLPVTTRLSDQVRPTVFAWALGLGASPALASHVPSFMTVNAQEQWNPLIQQLALLTDIDWAADDGQRLLGYVYHLVRDQPDFRLNTRRPDALLEAANDHYARIENTQRQIRRQRLIADQAERDARQQTIREREEDERRRQHAYERQQRASKWSGLKGAKPLSSPNGRLRIYELTNGWELHLEGVKMSHCVGSYTAHCLRGNFSIWSLRHKEGIKERSIVTIRVDARKRAIVEARARFNRVPEKEYRDLINAWAKKNKLNELENWERMYYV